ncbi:UDPglucose 6-dehydrogenase [Pilibacter termitis]|uniref:UDP-glucose 6-dehydrogenase n=1 Tax=Pilibacter termitis TaxID=263852 RepID=A0A1T4QF60_9ENTE|nr:UDP-glucose 6-dehydrogenase [Pilibacter termitis]SKA02141.1 UDPglucose 6-dehydrogenase [Pilibacter termitis]
MKKKTKIRWSASFRKAVLHGEYLVITTPIDYDEKKRSFDTTVIEFLMSKALEINPESKFVIKTTIPIGYIETLKEKFSNLNHIIFFSDFSRKESELYDNLYPTRLIIGDSTEDGKRIGEVYARNVWESDVEILYATETEAEAIKLFSNAYLSLRLAFFNELDTFATINELDCKKIIQGLSLDPRIGNHYNKPSFGFDGHFLPKDTKQLKANFWNVPERLISAIIESNKIRHDFVALNILQKTPKTIGVYRLGIEKERGNSYYCSVLEVIKRLKENGAKILIYEPRHIGPKFDGINVVHDLQEFKRQSEVILANRVDDDLFDVKDKVHTHDVFGLD